MVILFILIIDNVDLCALMISKKLVVEYLGKKKLPWTDKQLQYIIMITQNDSETKKPDN